MEQKIIIILVNWMLKVVRNHSFIFSKANISFIVQPNILHNYSNINGWNWSSCYAYDIEA